MTAKGRHVIYYKEIPVGEYDSIADLRLYSPADIYLDNADKFDDEGIMQDSIETVLANLHTFLSGNLPQGIRYKILTEKMQSTGLLDLIKGIDEFSGDISIDRADKRTYTSVPEDIPAGSGLLCSVPGEDFMITSSDRGRGERPSSMSGYFDKFTAVLENTPNGPVLRRAEWKDEIGNVIVKPQGEYFPLIALNEAFCISLADSCGMDVMRSWTVSAEAGFEKKIHFVTERFGVNNTPEGTVLRDLIFDTGMLLAGNIKDHYSISSEKYFDFMREILPDEDMKRFMKAYLFGYITGNSDMHVKNFSVRYTMEGFRLMPLYDLVSYKPYGNKNDLALTIGGREFVSEKRFLDFMAEQGMPEDEILKITASVEDNFDPAAQKYTDICGVRGSALINSIRDFAIKRCVAIRREIISKREIPCEETER